ncbi:NO-inducible flavohemoprotein [Herbaspirillum sp. alder98]|uniref:NO-inducible flavohemoprotein n=1 Tax=Herbaspirillum sp. alder98 TaxID=2913096 RepID=UPI001CD84C69|nr:NO-inducible flavohemoprotein [Herbaspirillum sp. alder98]MCA1323947.1 NO-inducible flavohemoprotein [Herbaspirillum sp. alder98]
MLTAAQLAIVKSTVPLLESGGEALTTHFYQMLMRDYPQVRPLFNRTHQESGDQPRALANGVLMYARHIDRLEALGPLAGQIVAKHVAIQVMPEHYPMVGDCLLRAIRDVLGAEIATDAVIEAWGAAYGQLADILIGAERQQYDAHANAPGGWRGARNFVVVRKVRESDEITSFHFRPEDGGALLDFAPGQYIGLRMVVDGEEQRRQYSLSAPLQQPGQPPQYRISVKREAGGRVSRQLHDAVDVGSVLELFPPSGDFTLSAGNKPLVLIAGGVGITPLLTMLAAALPDGRPVHFIHAARDAGAQAFRADLEALAAQHPQLRNFFCYELAREGDPAPHATGLLNGELLQRWMPATPDVDVYFVGPKPFMKAVRRMLLELGLPESQCRYEFFGPAASLH